MSGDGKAKSADNECIQVVARCRPLNRKENEEKRQSIVLIDSAIRQVALKIPESSQSGGEELKSFTFDATYDENTQQRIFYEESCFSIIECALEGFNSTIFAYGQTGCGKSFTMQGPSNAGDEMKGVIPNSFSHIFQFIKESKDVEFLIRCSYLELYNEEIRDLLCHPKTQTKCELKEDAQKGIFVKNLTDVVVESKEDLEAMLDKGLGNRTVASTLMNAESSRSHSIFTIVIEMTSKDKDTGKEMIRAGKLNLVDLAGSERQKKTGAKDATLKEGIKINLSLSALGNVISALSEGSKHIPYRDSKLTRLLQDSLGGNSKTMMIAAISPADYNYEETLSTLRYANRAKNIKNKPKVNEDPKDTIIREFKEEIERLRKLLAEQSVVHSAAPIVHASSAVVAPSTGAPLTTVEERNELDASMSSHSLEWNDGIETLPSTTPPITSDKKVNHVESPSGLENMATIAVSDVVSPLQPMQQQIHEDAAMQAKVKEAHDKLAEKDSQIELERQMREELTQRLHQLQNMLVVSHQTSVQRDDSEKKVNSESVRAAEKAAASPRLTAATSTASSAAVTPALQPPLAASSPVGANQQPPTSEEEKKRLQDEEEAQLRYKERRLKAKKQRELKQQQELQRILEEKRLMEEELEELRQSAVSIAAQPSQMQPAGGTRSSGLQSSSARGESPIPTQRGMGGPTNPADNAVLKKMSKIKKRYEKKLLAAEEELQEIREDFYYQRKQLLDAVIEQEKDTKLYEQICQSILNEKDLKKIIEKSRYDEDAEEWIIPYLKRKSIDSLDSSRGGHLYQYGTAAAGSPAIASTASTAAGVSMLPDINLSSYYNKASLGLEGNSNNSKATSASSAAGAAAVAAASKTTYNSGKSSAISRVPILTLPGGLTTSASVMSSNNNNNNGMYSFRSEGVPAAGSYGNGSAEDMPGIGFEKESKDKRKLKSSHNKHKVPKPSNNNNNNNGSNSSRVNEQKAVPPLSARNSSPLPVLQPPTAVSVQQQHFQATGIDEEGSGITAGPVDDWGFAVNNEHSPSTNNTNRNAFVKVTNNNNQQDVEYSDDEDFEAEDKNTHQTTPHPPLNGSKPPGSASGGEGGVNGRKVDTVGRKKKKKTSNNANSQQLVNIQSHHHEEFNGNVVTTLKQASPRVVSLPPIL